MPSIHISEDEKLPWIRSLLFTDFSLDYFAKPALFLGPYVSFSFRESESKRGRVPWNKVKVKKTGCFY